MQGSEVIVGGETNNPKSGRLQQTIASLIISLAPLNAGLVAGWISPMSLILTGEDSPVGILTKEDISLLAALPSYVTLLFAPLFSFVLNRYGRKIALQLLGLLSVISAIIITYSSSITTLYLGRLTAGFSLLGITLSSIYVTEFSHDSIRGTLTSFSMIQINVGLLISYVVGNISTYKLYNFTMILLPVIYSALSLWIPESPLFLFEQSRKEDALQSLMWYRGSNQTLVEEEIKTMESANANIIPETFTNLIFRTTGSRRAAAISILLCTIQMLSGFQIILNYNELIYQEVGSPLSIECSSIVIASITLVSSFLGMLMVDLFGRKPLLYLSFFIGVICMTALTIYLLVRMEGSTNFSWIPFACMNIFVFGYGLGLHSIPSLITTEIVVISLRPSIFAVITIIMIIFGIIVLQSFTFLDESIGLYSVFVVPAIVNLVGGIFTWCVVPETKGKSFVQITNELNST